MRLLAWLVSITAAVALSIAGLIALPDTSSVTTTHCSQWALICRMDAHQGVIALLALLIAVGAGVFAYLTFRGDQISHRLAKIQAVAREKDEEARYRSLLREMLYETVHNLHHLTRRMRWEKPEDPNDEYDGCRLDGWPDLQFRYTEQLLDVRHAVRLERDLPDVMGFLDHVLRNEKWIESHAESWKDLPVAKHYAWTSEHLVRVFVCARYRVAQTAQEPQEIQAIAHAVVTNAGLGCKVNPGSAAEGGNVAVELKDRVRLVEHEKGVNGRDCPTTVAFFRPVGTITDLFRCLKGMPDPPIRSPRVKPENLVASPKPDGADAAAE
jgi:hypothetical protein